MKKILLSFALVFFGFSYLVSANTVDFSYFEPEINEGEINMSKITVDLDKEVSGFILKRGTGLDDYLIWGDASQIQINGSKTGFNVDLCQYAKGLYFQGNFTGTLEITYSKIRVYKEEIRNAKLGLVVNGAKILSSKSLYSDSNKTNNDDMKPLSVGNVVGYWSGNDLFVKWDKSPDLDIYRYMVELITGSKVLQQKYTQPNIYEYIFKGVKTGDYIIKVYAKDYYYTSKPKEVLVNYDVSEKDTKKDLTGNIVKTGLDIVETGNKSDLIFEDYDNLLYTGYFKLFSGFANNLDNQIKTNIVGLSVEELLKTIKYRNDMLILLSDYVYKKITKKVLLKELISSYISFKSILK